jgi:hypothetical protein
MRQVAKFALFLATLVPALAGAQIALVTDLAGSAGKLAILSEVHAETAVELDGAMTVLYYASGDEFSLSGPARVVFGPKEPEVVQGAPARRVSSAAKPGALKPGGLAPATFVMRSKVSRELRAQIEAARPGPSATVAQRVRFAAWLEQLQLKDEARVYWKALAAERPDSQQLKELAAR